MINPNLIRGGANVLGAGLQFMPGAGTIAGLGIGMAGNLLADNMEQKQSNQMQAAQQQQIRDMNNIIRNNYDRQVLDMYPTTGVNSPYYPNGGMLPLSSTGGVGVGNPMGHNTPGGDIPVANAQGQPAGLIENGEVQSGNAIFSNRLGFSKIAQPLEEAKGALEKIVSNPNIKNLDKFQKGTRERTLGSLESVVSNLDNALESTFGLQEQSKQQTMPSPQGMGQQPMMPYGGILDDPPEGWRNVNGYETPEALSDPLVANAWEQYANQMGYLPKYKDDQLWGREHDDAWKQYGNQFMENYDNDYNKRSPVGNDYNKIAPLNYSLANKPKFNPMYVGQYGNVNPATNTAPANPGALSNMNNTDSQNSNNASNLGANLNGLNLGNFNGNAMDIMGAASPYIDNVANYFINKNMPKVPAPRMDRPAALKTDINIQPQLQNIDAQQQALNTNIRNNAVNSNVGRANMIAGMGQNVGAKNQLYGQKENIETDLRNKDAMNKQGVGQRNVGRANEYDLNVMSRKLAQQDNLSKNFANLSEDMMTQAKDYKALQRDIQDRGLIALQYADTGVLQSMYEMGYFNDQDEQMREHIKQRILSSGRTLKQ
jgi:hypothetical protein